MSAPAAASPGERSLRAARALVPSSPALRAGWVLAVVDTATLILAIVLICGVAAARVWAFPMRDPWFPAPLQHPVTYALPLLAIVVVGGRLVLRPSVAALRAWAGTLLVGGSMLMFHQASFGWAVSLLLFWSGLWAGWLATSGVARPDLAVRRGPFLCLFLIGLIFAFPAIGKATPGFTTGEIFWQLHWETGLGAHGFLETALGHGAHRRLAAIYGPVALTMESLLAFVWLLPARIGFPATLVGVVGILLSATPFFFDAMGILVGLTLSGWALAECRPSPRG